MKLYVARHGQTNYNDLGLCNSDPNTDVNLTEIGKEQAEKLANILKDVNIEQIFVSELKRTQQTANIINKFHNAPIKVDSRLNDNRTGYENKPSSEWRAAIEASGDKWSVRLNNGESLEDVKERTRSFLDELKSENYSSILVVTSKIIVQTVYGVLGHHSNQEAWELEVEKASCMEFEL